MASKYFSTVIVFLKTMGMIKLDHSTHKIVKFIYEFYRACVLLRTLLVIPQSILRIYSKDWTVFTEIAFNVLNVAIYTGVSLRIGYYQIFANKVRRLAEVADSIYQDSNNEDFFPKNVASDKKFCNYVTIGWQLNNFLSTGVMLLLPFIITENASLPLDVWYPWNTNGTRSFPIAVFDQFCAQVIMGTGYGNSDMFYFCVTCLFAGQLRMLGCSFKSCIYNSLVKCGVKKAKVVEFVKSFEGEIQVNDDYHEICDLMKGDAFTKICFEELKRCVNRHRVLLEFAESLEEFFSPVLLPTVFCNVLYIIFIAFIIVTVCLFLNSIRGRLFNISCFQTNNLNLAVQLVEYASISVFQIYVYCYFGQIITFEVSGRNDES